MSGRRYRRYFGGDRFGVRPVSHRDDPCRVLESVIDDLRRQIAELLRDVFECEGDYRHLALLDFPDVAAGQSPHCASAEHIAAVVEALADMRSDLDQAETRLLVAKESAACLSSRYLG